MSLARHSGQILLFCIVALRASGADPIPLTPRPHMDGATLAAYNRIRSADGILLGLGELFAPSANGERIEPNFQTSIARWKKLYGQRLPACYEFEMGEANRPSAVREWEDARRFADMGGLVWLQLSLNNFTVPHGGRQGRMVVGGMNDVRGGLDPVLPGGAAHGRFVTEMREFAREIKALGKPCVLRPFHEMNGRWFWWGGQPENYKRLWRFVFDLFQEEGVRNAIWCWAPSANTPRGPDYYPGGDVVDIIGTSQYFDAPALPADVMAGLAELATLAEDKPVWLAELGPLAREDFWRGAHASMAKVPRLRGFNLWLARGWHAWGSRPDRGSLIDEASPQELKDAFSNFLTEPKILSLERWNAKP